MWDITSPIRSINRMYMTNQICNPPMGWNVIGHNAYNEEQFVISSCWWPVTRQNVPPTISGLLLRKMFLQRYLACYKAKCSSDDTSIWPVIRKNVPPTISGLLQGKMFLRRYLACYNEKCSYDDIWSVTRQNVPPTISGLLQSKMFLRWHRACYKKNVSPTISGLL